jgi:DNA-binding transcriptional ArsR family regulator
MRIGAIRYRELGGTMGKHVQMAPTLWRTCRALANRQRLRLLRHLAITGAQTVTEVAEARAVSVSVARASADLRLLNAHGLLSVDRRGREAVYTLGADPTVADAGRLLPALEATVVEEGGVDAAFSLLTAFTHPRRAEIVQALEPGPLPRASLAMETGISFPAVCRHVRKLCDRELVVAGQERLTLAKPRGKLARALLKIALRKV